MPLAKVIAERPDVFNHNVEVVPRLYPVARRGSRWERSLRVLRNAKAMGGDEVTTKSGLMVGLGETHEEMVEAFGDLREQGVQVLTVGQYLRPTERHLPVVRYWQPEEFTALEAAAYDLGFEHVAAGPLVRSSYHADEHVKQSAARDRAARRAAPSARVFPLRDNIPTERFPVVTVAADRRERASSTSSSRTACSASPTRAWAATGRSSSTRRSRTRSPTPATVRGHRERRDRLRGAARRDGHGRPAAADVAHAVHVDVHARRPAAPRRQHAVPVDLRQQRRGRDGAGQVRRLLPARRPRGDAAQIARRHRLDRPDARRVGRGRRRARRLPPAVPARPRGDGRLHHLLLHDPRAAGDALPRHLVRPAGAVRLLRPRCSRRATAAAWRTSRTSAASCSGCSPSSCSRASSDDGASSSARGEDRDHRSWRWCSSACSGS